MNEASIHKRCGRCDTELAPAVLSCPACGRLVHAEQLRELTSAAEAAGAAGRHSEALAQWRQALELLPPSSKQATAVRERIEQAGRLAEQTAPLPPLPSAPVKTGVTTGGKWSKMAAGTGALGLLLWKFKVVLIFLLTKGKLLLLGMTKASTFFSMVLSLGVYWAAFGWKFALGLVLSIYVHEIGHVAALKHLGIKATAPMFIPGFGAVVRLKQYPATPREDARVGLAGPLWGCFAALATYAVALLTDWPSWAAIARVGAWINLFNLLPVWQLDGSRGFRAMTRGQRLLAAAALGAAWFFTHEGLLALLMVVAFARALSGKGAERRDDQALWTYLFLVAVLAALCLTPVPGLK